ncbi:MAG: UvrD-helicase domain-containing protein [Flavobacteriales bacterium]
MIYKSGAGSGKTYTLTREFLKLALQYDSPWAYKQILAVTFTKKAANEMKNRILEWLLEFANEEDISSNEKAKDILKTIDCSAEILQGRAALMHEHILHNYSDFSVQTIDSFVHRIIKSFSRDLKLSTDFEVEMDVEKVVTEVVAGQLRDMGEDQELSDTLQNFLEFQLEEEKSTRLKTELVDFFRSNSDEKAIESLEKLSAKSFDDFKKVRKEISALAKKLRTEIKDKQSALQSSVAPVIDDVTTHLKNWMLNSSLDKFINYGKTPLTCIKKENIFTGKKLESSAEHQTVNALILTELDGLIPLLDNYLVVSKLVKNCYLLALIQDYKQRFELYKEENNTVLISDFTTIIESVVKDNPAPFIYERLGERYRYYLIDEFQDTSLTQWQNFLPLITHTLAKGNLAMIVGDSKQAIYRWRNGDFKLFAELPKMHYEPDDYITKEAEAQLSLASCTEPLNTNYRSSAEVVKFNNQFFTGFETALSETGKAMYAGVKQTPAINKEDGHVEFQLFGTRKDDNELFLDRILEIIKEAEQRNFDLGDIAILARKNKKLAEIASFLSHSGVKTSSQEGLLLKHNLKVRLVMGLLHAVAYPLDDSNNTQLFTLLETWNEKEADLLLHSSDLEKYTTEEKRTHLRIRIWNYLEKLMGKADAVTWKSASAYDALLGIVASLKLDSEPDDYIETLLDFSFHAARRGQNSVKEFLKFWKDHDKLSLSTAEDKNSVKLMTVHKSKGLEFPVVIYAEPFSQGRSGDIWYDLNGFDVPLEQTIHKDGGFFTSKHKAHQGLSPKFDLVKNIVEHETSEKFLDGLNILYVALTRASQNLFILGLTATDPLKDPTIEVFQNVFQHDLKTEVFKTGILTEKRESDEADEVPVDIIPSSLKSYDWKNRLAFRFTNKELDTEESTVTERTIGIQMHNALAEFKWIENWAEFKEDLEEKIIDEDILNGLAELSQAAEWKNWFTSPVNIWNEKHLLDSDGNEFIPDRVMEFENEVIVADYKAGSPTTKHPEQVKNYISLLSNLFEKPVIGMLVYVKERKMVEVD